MSAGPGRPAPGAPADRSFAELLAARRMCRDFLDEPVDPAALRRVADAVTRAPSAGNTRALDLLVLTGADAAAYWDLTLPAGRRAGFAWPGLPAAPVLMLAYVDPAAYVRRYAEADKVATGLGAGEEAWPVPYWFVDGGAAVMALLLAVEAEGLGALFFGQFGHEEAVAEAFGVPPGRRALGTVAVGHPRPGGRHRSTSARRGRPTPDDVLHLGHW